jgi:hypothetical protein
MSGFKRFNRAKGVMGDNVTESQCKHTQVYIALRFVRWMSLCWKDVALILSFSVYVQDC